MTDPYFDSLPLGDFRPEDFTAPLPGGLEISSAFVESTLARVRADRDAIERDAARVDEMPLPRDLLAAYAAPAPAADFVARTWSRIETERARDDERFETLLSTFAVPSTHPDFVARTLDALRVERSGLRLLGTDHPRRGIERRVAPARHRMSLLTAAAALALFALAWALWPRGDAREKTTEIAVESAQQFTPVVWATSLERMNERDSGGIRFEPVDALHLLAAEAAGEVR